MIGSSATDTRDFYYRAALGSVPGVTQLNQYGSNPDVDTGTVPEDIWDFGGVYNFSSTDDIDSISSSSASDTGPVLVQGLDTDWNAVNQVVTLNGQTRVALTTPLIRVNGVLNAGATDFVGNVYTYVNTAITDGVPDDTDKIRALVLIGNNATRMCVYSVASGTKLLIQKGFFGYGKSSSTGADIGFRTRPFGGVFYNRSDLAVIGTGTSFLPYEYNTPLLVPAKTDIVARCYSAEALNTVLTAGFDALIIND